MLERGTHPLPFFWKCVKRKGFKSFVLKVCETKGVADAFLRKCVKLKSLHDVGRIRASICSFSTPHRNLLGTPAVSLAALSAATLHPLLAGSGQGGAWRLLQKYVYHNEWRLSKPDLVALEAKNS